MRLIDADELIESTPNILIMCLGGRSTGKTMATYEELFKKKVNETPTVDAIPTSVIEDIKAELQKLADDEWNQQVGSVSQGFEDAIEIIDKHLEGTDLGDYPDTIPYQFDNMTGSMNL